VPDMPGQVRHNPLAPFGCSQLGTDVAAHLPLQAHQLGVDGLVGALAGCMDQADNLGKRQFLRRRHRNLPIITRR
jgi:hypothetical protein